jgi:hypothetical protein
MALHIQHDIEAARGRAGYRKLFNYLRGWIPDTGQNRRLHIQCFSHYYDHVLDDVVSTSRITLSIDDSCQQLQINPLQMILQRVEP